MGAGFGEAGEAAVEEDVVLVAREHELLAGDFDGGNVAAGSENFNFVGDEEIASGAGEGAEAVNPLALEVVHVICGEGFG